MRNYKQQFKNKKITIMGLGLLGRGLGYTKFLAECGADLIVTDLKTKEQLETSLKELKKFKNIKFVLGEHRLEDFKGRGTIIKAAGVPMDSKYIDEARRNNIPVEMDVSLFAKCAPNVKIVGVTGTRGKSMTTQIIYEILKANLKKNNVYIGGNVRGVATLPLLKKVKDGDILVCELDSWQLQGFGDAKISPSISVFTTFMPDHMNYYKNDMQKYFGDKANIFKYQNSNDTLVILPEMKDLIKQNDVKGKLIVANGDDVKDWDFNIPGDHHRNNLSCAVEVVKQFNIPIEKIKKTVKKFEGIEGRLQLVKTYKGVKIYNDNNATTPEATIAGLKALGNNQRNIVLICGGADKGLDLTNLISNINEYCKAIILIPGTGTDKLNNSIDAFSKVKVNHVKDLHEAVKEAINHTTKGDIILFSPAFASFGMFNNEYERNDLFMKIIKKLK